MPKEYIEREALLKVLHQRIPISINEYDKRLFYDGGNMCLSLLEEFVEQLPTADVVEVTYCRDCTHCDPENKHCDHPMGTSLSVPRKDTDFCSYGERKDCEVN